MFGLKLDEQRQGRGGQGRGFKAQKGPMWTMRVFGFTYYCILSPSCNLRVYMIRQQSPNPESLSSSTAGFRTLLVFNYNTCLSYGSVQTPVLSANLLGASSPSICQMSPPNFQSQFLAVNIFKVSSFVFFFFLLLAQKPQNLTLHCPFCAYASSDDGGSNSLSRRRKGKAFDMGIKGITNGGRRGQSS